MQDFTKDLIDKLSKEVVELEKDMLDTEKLVLMAQKKIKQKITNKLNAIEFLKN